MLNKPSWLYLIKLLFENVEIAIWSDFGEMQVPLAGVVKEVHPSAFAGHFTQQAQAAMVSTENFVFRYWVPARFHTLGHPCFIDIRIRGADVVQIRLKS